MLEVILLVIICVVNIVSDGHGKSHTVSGHFCGWSSE